MHVRQTDGAIAAEMLTYAVQEKKNLFSQNKHSRGLFCLRPLIIVRIQLRLVLIEEAASSSVAMLGCNLSYSRKKVFMPISEASPEVMCCSNR